MANNYKKKHTLLLLTLFFLFTTVLFFWFDWKDNHRKFTFAMLDVGQGDALWIESPTGTQILVDGGPVGKILGALPRVMPAYDRTIDAIIITNPDQDHIGGLMDIVKSYKVQAVFVSGTTSDSKTYQNLESEIKNKNIPEITVQSGMRLNLGSGAIMDILFPDRDVSDWATNEGSVVAKVTYGSTKIMLTGDAPTTTEKIILRENSPKNLKSNILKVGHHGSRTSSSRKFVETISPMYALISDGEKNKYGHPHQGILNLFNELKVKTLRTDELGTIIVKSDGTKEDFRFFK